MTLNSIYNLILKRKKQMPQNSYVADLFRSGNDRIIQKVGEEATEVVIAAKNGKKGQIIAETADLWFNTLILLTSFNIKIKDIENELNRRRKTKIRKLSKISDKMNTYD